MRKLLVVFILFLFSCDKINEEPLPLPDEKDWECTIKTFFFTGYNPPTIDSSTTIVIVDSMTEQEIREYEKEHTFHISHYKSECYCVEL